VQVTSFVRPEWIPQLADAEEVMRGATRRPGVELNALVPNRRGLERALAAGADSVMLVVSASATPNRKNLNRQPEGTVAEYEALVPEAGVTVYADISTSFGCPYEGFVSEDAVESIAGRLFAIGVEEVGIADTTGVGNPTQVERLCARLREAFDGRLTLHLHDTRGMGLANVVAGLRGGIDAFDGSVGGLGGCPYAPGATGNVATEDVVHMLGEMGI